MGEWYFEYDDTSKIVRGLLGDIASLLRYASGEYCNHKWGKRRTKWECC